MMNDSGLDISQ